MKVVEKKGKSVDEATKAALEELGVSLDDVSVEIIEEPSKGLLGIGKKMAVVKVTLKDRPDAKARETLEDLLQAMKIDYKIDRVDYEEGTVRINITGRDMGLLIGRKGDTLNALQFLLGLMVNRNAEDRVRVVLDVEDYRLRREESLVSLAEKLSERVKKTQRSVIMRPMSPQERRIVHTALQGDPQIVTYSQGDEPNRKVIISLKK
ncbi:MAG: RNA-binding cell elongation regulator Jag/EloR [Candidatus Saccharibacteria bacterium]